MYAEFRHKARRTEIGVSEKVKLVFLSKVRNSPSRGQLQKRNYTYRLPLVKKCANNSVIQNLKFFILGLFNLVKKFDENAVTRLDVAAHLQSNYLCYRRFSAFSPLAHFIL
jgi:hypothetical protein